LPFHATREEAVWQLSNEGAEPVYNMSPVKAPRPSASPPRSSTPAPPAGPERTITWRSVGLAVVLIPLNALWIVMIEQAWGNIFSTTLSLFFSAVVSLLLVLALNAGLHRWAPPQALVPAELAAVYSMLAVSAGIGGLDAIQILIPVMVHAFRFATP